MKDTVARETPNDKAGPVKMTPNPTKANPTPAKTTVQKSNPGRDRGAGGGAISRLRTLVRWGLGGRVASGTQSMSWIHEHDLNRLFERALNQEDMRGVYIASSPNPVSQVEFMRSLRRQMGVLIGLPATEWMVRIGAPLLMQTDPELALYGRSVISRRLSEEGFAFEYTDLEKALEVVIRKTG